MRQSSGPPVVNEPRPPRIERAPKLDLMTRTRKPGRTRSIERVSVELSAVLVAAIGEEPHVLTVTADDGRGHALPSGPLEAQDRTLELGLRAWVAEHAKQPVGYVEQLYTFGDRDRQQKVAPPAVRALSIGYLALVPAASRVDELRAHWHEWYRYFPWEDWRNGEPKGMAAIRRVCHAWIAEGAGSAERDARAARVQGAFGSPKERWNEERVLERYELLYEIGFVSEALRGRRDGYARSRDPSSSGEPMLADHRRILATAISRLRGKIKYRPVIFELIPPSFTLSQLQGTVEGLAGIRLHKPNFRRLVASQGLVEPTGDMISDTRGRPARLVRFRREVMLEHPGLAGRLPVVGHARVRRRH